MRMISLALAGLLLAGTAMGQQSTPPQPTKPAAPPAADSLEAQIAEALKSNPEIQIAEARARDAQVDLSVARRAVARNVTAAHNELRAAKVTVDALQRILAKHKEITGQVGTVEVLKAEVDVARAESDVAAKEAALAKAIGQAPRGTVTLREELPARLLGDALAFDPDGRRLWSAHADGTVRVWDAATGKALSTVPEVKPGSMTEKIRAALDKPVKIDNPFDGSVKDILEFLHDYVKGRAAIDIPFRMLPMQKMNDAHVDNLMTGELPLSGWLLAIEDSVPELRIVVREYGLLVTTKDRMPEDAVRLREFLRSTAAKPKEEPKKQ